jgi:hypothetical protein
MNDHPEAAEAASDEARAELALDRRKDEVAIAPRAYEQVFHAE